MIKERRDSHTLPIVLFFSLFVRACRGVKSRKIKTAKPQHQSSTDASYLRKRGLSAKTPHPTQNRPFYFLQATRDLFSSPFLKQPKTLKDQPEGDASSKGNASSNRERLTLSKAGIHAEKQSLLRACPQAGLGTVHTAPPPLCSHAVPAVWHQPCSTYNIVITQGGAI